MNIKLCTSSSMLTNHSASIRARVCGCKRHLDVNVTDIFSPAARHFLHLSANLNVAIENSPAESKAQVVINCERRSLKKPMSSVSVHAAIAHCFVTILKNGLGDDVVKESD